MKPPQEAAQPGARSRPASLRPPGSRFWVCFGIKVLFEATQTRISVGRVPSPHGDLRWRHVRPGRHLLAFCLWPSGSCCWGQLASGGRGASPSRHLHVTRRDRRVLLEPQGKPKGLAFLRPRCPRAAAVPPLLGQGVLPWPVTLRPTVRSGGRPRPRERPPPPRTCPALSEGCDAPSLRVARGRFQILLGTDSRQHLPPGTPASGPGRTQARARPPPRQD